MMILPVLALALLEVVSSMAPVMLEEATMTATGLETELYEILKTGLLNDPENLEKMREKFTLGPNEKRLCVHLNYTITCTDVEECGNATTPFNCSTEYSFTNIWLSFNSTPLAGRILFEYAALNFEVLGLNWAGACDLSPEVTLYLSINVTSLQLLCGVDGETYINDSLRSLTKQVSSKMPPTYCIIELCINLQIPSFVNISNSAQSYSITDNNHAVIGVQDVVWIFSLFVSTVLVTSMYPYVAEHLKTTKKEKAYFQFWAFHAFIIGLGAYTITLNSHLFDVHVYSKVVCIGYVTVMPPMFIFLGSGRGIRLNTVAQFCCHNSKYYIMVVYIISVYVFMFFTCLFLTLTPTVYLIFYLYPIHTVIRVPFILNSALYTNSVVALLIYQSERFGYISTRWFREYKGYTDCKDLFYEKYYQVFKSKSYWSKLCYFIGYIMISPLGSVILLVALIFFIITVHNLFEMNLSQFTDKSQVEMLFTLVPTLLLLFGSWYRLDLFFDEEEKSEKELLKEILRKMEKLNCRRPSEVNNGNAESKTVPGSPFMGEGDDLSTESGAANSGSIDVGLHESDGESTPLLPSIN